MSPSFETFGRAYGEIRSQDAPALFGRRAAVVDERPEKTAALKLGNRGVEVDLRGIDRGERAHQLIPMRSVPPRGAWSALRACSSPPPLQAATSTANPIAANPAGTRIASGIRPFHQSVNVYARATKRRDRLTGLHLKVYHRASEWAPMGLPTPRPAALRRPPTAVWRRVLGTHLGLMLSIKRNKNPRFTGVLGADDGIRTHDLLHGKERAQDDSGRRGTPDRMVERSRSARR